MRATAFFAAHECHMRLRASDFDRSRAFYTAFLGASPKDRSAPAHLPRNHPRLDQAAVNGA
jgi:catechol 2,3-dioxygenase-like lactoylglutathione lyase family enzyme